MPFLPHVYDVNHIDYNLLWKQYRVTMPQSKLLLYPLHIFLPEFLHFLPLQQCDRNTPSQIYLFLFDTCHIFPSVNWLKYRFACFHLDYTIVFNNLPQKCRVSQLPNVIMQGQNIVFSTFEFPHKS